MTDPLVTQAAALHRVLINLDAPQRESESPSPSEVAAKTIDEHEAGLFVTTVLKDAQTLYSNIIDRSENVSPPKSDDYTESLDVLDLPHGFSL